MADTRSASELEKLGVVPRNDRAHLSFSQLNAYHDCGVKYELQYREKAEREPQGALLGGIAVHRAIEISEREGYWLDDMNFAHPDAPAIAVFLKILMDSIRDAGGDEKIRWGGKGGGEGQLWWRKNGEWMMRRYQVTRFAMSANGWDVLENETEYRVEAELKGVSSPVVGYLDKYLMHEGGDPLIVDWKTGRIGNANPMQFATYGRMIQVVLGLQVERGVAVFLRAPDAARRVQPVRFAELIPRVDEMYASLEGEIEREVFTPNPQAWHSSCAVRDACWYWQATKPEGEE